jgi:hypothetical protein
MSNVFQEILPEDELPQEVRQQTLSNLYTLRLVLDVVDLFVVKGTTALGNVLTGGATGDRDEQEMKRHEPAANGLEETTG